MCTVASTRFNTLSPPAYGLREPELRRPRRSEPDGGYGTAGSCRSPWRAGGQTKIPSGPENWNLGRHLTSNRVGDFGILSRLGWGVFVAVACFPRPRHQEYQRNHKFGPPGVCILLHSVAWGRCCRRDGHGTSVRGEARLSRKGRMSHVLAAIDTLSVVQHRIYRRGRGRYHGQQEELVSLHLKGKLVRRYLHSDCAYGASHSRRPSPLAECNFRTLRISKAVSHSMNMGLLVYCRMCNAGDMHVA